MAQVIWPPSALMDVESIATFIARDSLDQAALFVNRLIEYTDRLQKFPFSGRIIPEIGDDNCREIIYGNYRIMYKIEIDQIWITGIIHGARDWKPQ
ncbi:MAG: type II toxin-antitoxin system RelE/ParE family toxin [Candidatus Brocadiales bacterium]|nr:type II toxin-antitoxin system RelE/ParE family toxin [Candidatus Brocadiales bacterium]